jgi:EAL domain-containing protein (putative c-di-GMP-specific phosphodiesterase class I)
MGRAIAGYRAEGPHNLPSFVIAYQPIVNVRTRSIAAYEALTRGLDGECYPRLVAHLNASALRTFHRRTADAAIRRAVELGLVGLGASLAINLQPDVHANALDAKFLASAADRHGLPRARLTIEFTENRKLTIPEYEILLTRNKEAGFVSSIDDFGAGYSGLTMLVECRIEVLKLDRALIQGIDASERRQKIVAAFTSCCKALNIQVVAEGIETKAEYEMLFELGIDLMQGYYFSHPGMDHLPLATVRGIDCPPWALTHTLAPDLLPFAKQLSSRPLILQA